MNQKTVAMMVIFILLGVVVYVLVQKAYPGVLPNLGTITQNKESLRTPAKSGGSMMQTGTQSESSESLMSELSATVDDGGISDLKNLEKDAAGL